MSPTEQNMSDLIRGRRTVKRRNLASALWASPTVKLKSNEKGLTLFCHRLMDRFPLSSAGCGIILADKTWTCPFSRSSLRVGSLSQWIQSSASALKTCLYFHPKLRAWPSDRALPLDFYARFWILMEFSLQQGCVASYPLTLLLQYCTLQSWSL